MPRVWDVVGVVGIGRPIQGRGIRVWLSGRVAAAAQQDVPAWREPSDLRRRPALPDWQVDFRSATACAR